MDLKNGTNIKHLRLAKGLTQEQLADLLGISTAAVSKWEARNTYPDITMLFPLAESKAASCARGYRWRICNFKSVSKLVGQQWTKNRTAFCKKYARVPLLE